MFKLLLKNLPPSHGPQGKRPFQKSGFLVLATVFFLLCSGLVQAQQRSVSGVVSGEGSPLAGVTVVLKGSTNGTSTDAEGRYTLSLSDAQANGTLVFSYIGFLSKEVAIAGQPTVNVTLQSDAKALDEIVVVGYGTQNKRDVTGSVASLDEKDFNAGPITSPLQQINGRAAGVNINQVGSEPGQAPSIRIRGITSLIGGNDPLVVVDGIQGDLNLLKQIPPSEIESIEILKDASATAIYGSRGAAGVVLVTTKKGSAGTTTVEYSGVGSVETIAKNYELLNASEYRAAAAARGIENTYDFGGDTDWVDAITRRGYTTTHNLAVSGGTENFTYRTSLTGILQQGIIKKSNSENYIARFQGMQSAFKDKLALTFNLNTSVLTNDFNNGGRIGEAINRRPTDPIYVENPLNKDTGPYFIDPNGFNYLNPVARTTEIVDGDRTNNLFGSLRAEYTILNGLTATAFGSWRKTDREYQNYISARTTQESARNLGVVPANLTGAERNLYIQNLPDGIASRELNSSDEKLFNFILNYKKEFGDHSIDVIGVNEWQQQVYNGFRASARGFTVDTENNLSSLQSSDPTLFQAGNITSYKSDRTLASFLGRVNYSFKDRYMLSASFRRDGSSVFGANNKWANFFAVSGAWRISEEAFMSGLDVMNDFKLRVGYGETGNQQGLGPLNSVRLVNNDGTVFFGGSVIPNFSITQNENRDLQWEVKKMYNAGIDFGFFEGKLSGTFDGYYGLTSDLLFDYAVPQPPYPFGTIKANIGEIMNKGLEASLSYILVDNENVGVTLAGNVSTTKTEVKELSGSLNGLPLETDYVVWASGGTTGVASTNNAISHLIIGQSLGTFYLFKHAGVDANGNQIIDDLNGDGVISDGNRENPDRYVAGQALPKFTWAFTPSARFKSFDLNMVVRGAHGHKIFNARRATMSALGSFGQTNMLKSALEDGINNLTYATDYWLEDGDFARLENLTLGYNVNTEKFGAVKSLRFSFTANNLFVITGYSGIDPELSTSGGSGFGVDYGIYPRTRSFALGINATF
ncbi:SusC/RagA family TonB-linked outer membrane protein [Nibribacter ruber]|uniref:SusC/RagA family TonB-linked outer membrane protein n=1 Tax=Nibribacter ruber TaxID=2698458 RepID=A0A6P1NWS0_9BACT|nr:TonB-dependent receptor [Nibribacter ruber]QHL86669.1 SusC/RagA family TonB-linked outer membrane protein [Nibribacter ruber]